MANDLAIRDRPLATHGDARLGRFAALSAIAAALAVGSACGGASSPKDDEVQYAEGVVATDEESPTIGGRALPAAANDLKEAIRTFRGMQIGIEYDKQSAKVVSPIEDEWEQLSASIEGFASLSRDHLLLPRGNVKREPFADRGILLQLDAQIADIDRRYKLLPSSAGTDRPRALNELVDSLKTAVTLGVQVADKPDATISQRTAALALAAAARDQYTRGELQNYEGAFERPARFYRNVTTHLDATVGVRLKNASVEGTGFLLSKEWVLTARHVVAKVGDPAGIKVVFRYEEDDAGATTGGVTCDVTEVKLSDPSENIDAAALKFQCNAAPLPPTAVPLRLSTRHPDLDEQVYVVGHPKHSPKRVADNAFIRFPHRASVSMLELMRSRATKPEERADLDLAYTPCATGFWCYRSAPERWDAGSESSLVWPTVGFAANTYKGNSGSPLFFAADHTVAGLVFGGRRDADAAGSFSFFRHEGAVPAVTLVAWLGAKGIAFNE